MQWIKKYSIVLIIILLIGSAGISIYSKLHPKTLPANLIEGAGRIDGDLINLNVKYPGRVIDFTVDDGDAVTKNMVIAKLVSAEYEAQKEEVKNRIVSQQRLLDAKLIELEIAKKTIPLALKRARTALQTRYSQLAELEPGISAQKAIVKQSEKDYKRLSVLQKQKLIELHTLEQARLKFETDRKQLLSLQYKHKQLQQAVSIAQNDLVEAEASQKKILALQNTVEAARAGIKAIESSGQRIDAAMAELTLRSPVNGFVVEKIANVGEVVGAGMPVATLIDPDSLYLRLFVDTIENGKIKLGDKAVIFTDAYPDRPIAASVVNIAQKAEFTPKEVSVRSDRIQRVFSVHLKPLHPDALLKLGLPAIGVISLDGKGLPDSLGEIPAL